VCLFSNNYNDDDDNNDNDDYNYNYNSSHNYNTASYMCVYDIYSRISNCRFSVAICCKLPMKYENDWTA